MRPAATVSVHPPWGICSCLRYDGRPRSWRHRLRTLYSIATGRLSGNLERHEKLPAFPAMLRQPRPCHIPDPDLGRSVTSVRDEVNERSLGVTSMFEGYLLLSRHELVAVRLRPGTCCLPIQVAFQPPHRNSR